MEPEEVIELGPTRAPQQSSGGAPNKVHPTTDTAWTSQDTSGTCDRCKECCLPEEITCCKMFFFIISMILLIIYFCMMVVGAARFHSCVGSTSIGTYMIVEGIFVMIAVILFAIWICHRCVSPVAFICIVFPSFTFVMIWSIVGYAWIHQSSCQTFPIFSDAIGFSSPIWGIILLVGGRWIFKNFKNDEHGVCVADEENTECWCCDCEAMASSLTDCLD